MHVLAIIVLVVLIGGLVAASVGVMAWSDGWHGALIMVGIWVFAVTFTAAFMWAVNELGFK